MDEADSAQRAADRAARQSYGKLVAYLTARSGDVAAAEDALSEAFAAALAHWPSEGVPRSPEAWLLTAARHRLADHDRRRKTRDEASLTLLFFLEGLDEQWDLDAASIPDRRLALLFACAHPAIDEAARAPLMLQTILGLNANAIAAAFLTAPTAMGQRLVRAKKRIREAGIPFAIPERIDLAERLDAVLQAIYAAFGAGWADPLGLDKNRCELAEEAIWLGRVVVQLLPDEPEALGLLALMLHAEARRKARRDANGAYVPLSQQNPAEWDGAAIEEAETLLRRAGAMARMGRFQLEAAAQSVHAARYRGGVTDWPALVELYDGLVLLTQSPVAALNRAATLAQCAGAAAGLAALDEVATDERLAEYQPYFALRADLLARLGQDADAKAAYERAIALETDPDARRFLEQSRDASR